MDDHGGAYRAQFQAYAKERRLEIVIGKAFSANNHQPAKVVQSRRSLTSSFSEPRLPPIIRSSNKESLPGCGPWAVVSAGGDPEAKRRKRVARYKAYAVEGKMKTSLKKGLRWVKSTWSKMVHGF